MRATFTAPNNATVTVEHGPVSQALAALHPNGTILEALGGHCEKIDGVWRPVQNGQAQLDSIAAAFERRCRAAAVRKAAAGVNSTLEARAHCPQAL
jgi:hypothetical protein